MKLRLLNIQLLIVAILAVLSLGACTWPFEPNPDPDPDPDPDPVEPTIEVVDRTVLVYMVAANSLGRPGSYGEYDLKDLDEMKQAARAGAITNGRLLVYHVPYSTDPVLLEVTPQGLDTLCRYDNSQLSITSERMSQVFSDMRATAPARDYGLILWSHASGWLENGIDDPAPDSPTTLSFGDHSGKRMNITTLARTLEGNDFSFVYFDCCNMANVEVAYQLRGVTPLMVASVTELPGPGMPYQLTVPHFFAPHQADLISAAQATYGIYAEGTAHPGYDYLTISVIDLTAMGRLAEAVRNYYLYMSYGFPSRRPQRFSTNNYYYDLEDYLTALNEDAADRIGFTHIDDAYRTAVEAISAAVLYQAALPTFNNIPINKHCGLSTYILSDENAAATMNYNRLDWFNDVAYPLVTNL